MISEIRHHFRNILSTLLIDLPAQFSRQQITMRTELRRILIHAAYQSFPAGFFSVPYLLQYLIDFFQNRAVESIVRRLRRGRRYGLFECRLINGQRLN